MHPIILSSAAGVHIGPGVDIKQGRAQWLQDQANGSAIYSVRVQSVFERIFIVISKERHIVTALPPT